jgi:hypothetical protein
MGGLVTDYVPYRRKWRRPATDFPDRRHANNVADLVHKARSDAEAADEAFYQSLLEEGTDEED